MSNEPTIPDHREECYRCHKAKVVCICDRIVPVNNRTNMHILQHIGERGHAVGTVRIAELGLKNVAVQTVLRHESNGFRADPAGGQRMGLLYPSADAVDLEDLAPGDRPDTLVVLDGTWPQAKSLYRDNPWLQEIPHYKITPRAPGNYRIRQEPSDTCLSTVEAIAAALTALEPETEGVENLLTAFDGMIDDQIEFLKRRGPDTWRIRKPRQKEQRSVPRALRGNMDTIVVGYGETIPWGEHHGERDLLSFCGYRLGDGQVFECFLAPIHEAPHLDWLLGKVGFNKDQYHAACVSRDVFIERWNRFFQPDDTLVAWNKGTLRDLFTLVERPASYQFLKAAYGNVSKQKCGHLEDVITREDLTVADLPFQGRAGHRMGSAVAVARFLNQHNS